MATKASTKDVSDNTEEANEASLAGAGNLADAVKKLLKKGKERGYVTLDELNAVMPPERISSELIEDVMAQLNDMGINVVENEESEDGDAAPADGDGPAVAEDYGRTDDPVRLYLREMGAVELLSREGEIAIAKRIEAGREMMINGICESPLTIQAILDWNEALKEGRLLLRDIIDLEATQTPDDAGALPSAGSGELADTDGDGDKATDEAAHKDGDTDGEGEGEGNDISGFEDEDNISLAAIEEKLKPQVIETFDKIAATYAKLGKLQHQRLQAIEKGEEPDRKAEGKIEGYQIELVDLVRTVRFNNARLEQLVQQLYTLNRRLMGFEGRLLRLAIDVQLPREDFLERYYGHELDPNWYDYILQLPPERAPEPKIVAAPRQQRISPREAERLAKAEAAKKAAELKAAEKAAKADAAAQARAQKEADKQAAAAAREAEKEAARIAREKEAAAKQAKAEAEREKAARLKAREQEARQREAEKKRAAAEKAAAKKAADKAKADAAKQKEAERRAREKEKAQAALDKARALKAKEAAKKAAVKKPAAKAAVKKPAAKSSAKPVAKKPAPKPVAKKPVKKAAPAKKAPVKAAAKAPARKPAAKPVKKPAPKAVKAKAKKR